MLTFPEMNGIRMQCADEEPVHIGLSAADGRMAYEALLLRVRDPESAKRQIGGDIVPGLLQENQ